MIASSSTFCPHLGRVIRDLFCQLQAVLHGTEALVNSNHPREAAASSYLATIFWHTMAPPLNCCANAALASVLALVWAVVALNNQQ